MMIFSYILASLCCLPSRSFTGAALCVVGRRAPSLAFKITYFSPEHNKRPLVSIGIDITGVGHGGHDGHGACQKDYHHKQESYIVYVDGLHDKLCQLFVECQKFLVKLWVFALGSPHIS